MLDKIPDEGKRRKYKMPFKPISTQEEFDEAIVARLKREKQSIEQELRPLIAKEYGDYESLKEFKAKTDAAKSTEDKARKKLEEDLAAANTKIKGYEIDALKSKVLGDMEIPYQIRDKAKALITGDSEESLAESANAIKELIGTKTGDIGMIAKDPDLSANNKESASVWGRAIKKED
jgi:hypothetical protein